MFELFVTKSFALNLKKLEKKERKRIKQKLRTASRNPWLFFERLKGFPLFKLRAGKYRVIAQMNSTEKRIILLSVSHRKKVYRKL